jgi:hypothetical protein
MWGAIRCPADGGWEEKGKKTHHVPSSIKLTTNQTSSGASCNPKRAERSQSLKQAKSKDDLIWTLNTLKKKKKQVSGTRDPESHHFGARRRLAATSERGGNGWRTLSKCRTQLWVQLWTPIREIWVHDYCCSLPTWLMPWRFRGVYVCIYVYCSLYLYTSIALYLYTSIPLLL